MGQKYIKAYLGHVSPSTFAFSFPAENKQNVINVLTAENRINRYILVDEEEEEKIRKQQEELKAKVLTKHKPTIKDTNGINS